MLDGMQRGALASGVVLKRHHPDMRGLPPVHPGSPADARPSARLQGPASTGQPQALPACHTLRSQSRWALVSSALALWLGSVFSSVHAQVPLHVLQQAPARAIPLEPLAQAPQPQRVPLARPMPPSPHNPIGTTAPAGPDAGLAPARPLLFQTGPAPTDASTRPPLSASLTDDVDLALDALIRPYLMPPENFTGVKGAAMDIKPIDLTADPDDIWQRIRHGFAIRNMSSPQVPQRMATLLNDPQRLHNLLERAGPYLYYIVGECERRGLPTELALLPFIESSFNPHSTSPAGAAGLWQFIPSTGKAFKLRQGGGLDERRDIQASTQAALDYLSQLFDMYGDWYLALAAYNWGEGSVRRALEANRRGNLGEDYLSLRMPDETRNYVPKLQAIKNIIDSPQAFNFQLPPVENKPFFVSVSRSKGIDVHTAARLAELPVETFRDLNPGFRSYISPDPERSLLVPADKAGQFENAMRRYIAQAPVRVGLQKDLRRSSPVGLNASPGQTGSNAAATQGDNEAGGGLQDTVSGFFRPYLFKPTEAAQLPQAPGTRIATGGERTAPRVSTPVKPAVGNRAGVSAPKKPSAPNRPAAPVKRSP